jgi:hypothetical protein
MSSSEIGRRVAVVRTDFSEERIPFIIRMTRISKLGKTLSSVLQLLVIASVGTSSPILVTLMMEAIHFYNSHTVPHPRRRHSSESEMFSGSVRQMYCFGVCQLQCAIHRSGN